MTAHHFFADPEDVTDDQVVLRGDEAHHAARALRIREGEPITVADGSGRIVNALVRRVGEVVEADVTAVRTDAAPRPAITLHQAIAKGDKLDVIVEKATEVGVRRIVPFVAERSIVRWDERKLQRVHERLRSVALAAAKQSGSAFVPDVSPVAQGPQAAPSPCFVLHEAATQRLREVLPDAPPDDLSLVVGPEGGLSEAEVERLAADGARAVSLGSRILRTETAGLVAATIVGFAYGWIA